MRYSFDLHMHSRHSFDGKMSVRKMADMALKRGLSGIAVADHNSFSGSEELLSADLRDLLAIPAVEYVTEVGHVLCLFVTGGVASRGVSPRSPNCYDSGEVIAAVHEMGGIAVLAHPFKKRNAAHLPQELARFDAVEAFNARAAYKRTDANLLAARAALENGLPYTSGSDAHLYSEIGNGRLSLELPELSLDALKAGILAGTGEVSGRNGLQICEGISQLYRVKKLGIYHKLPHIMMYGMKAAGMDVLRTMGAARKGPEGVLIESGRLSKTAQTG